MQQLADRVVPPTTASQINKLEKGETQITQRWLYRLAAALGVHPIEILEPLPPPLSKSEEALVKLYREMGDGDQAAVFRVADAIAQSRPPVKDHTGEN